MAGLRHLAFGTGRRRGFFMAADVAFQLLLLPVIGEGDAAIRALRHVTAEFALQRGGVTAAVQEQDGLLLALQPLQDRLRQDRGENGAFLFVPRHLAHVHHTDDGHLLVVGARGHFQEPVFSLLRVVITFQAGGGGAEHHHGLLHLGADHRHVARVVAGRFLLLVGMLVLLVHDDQPQPLHRREHGRARADGDAGAALADFVPFVMAFAGGQMAVQARPPAFAAARN